MYTVESRAHIKAAASAAVVMSPLHDGESFPEKDKVFPELPLCSKGMGKVEDLGKPTTTICSTNFCNCIYAEQRGESLMKF